MSPENPPTTEVAPAAPPPSKRGENESSPAVRDPNRYFRIADAPEGPTAPIDGDVTARRARRAMARLLAELEAAGD